GNFHLSELTLHAAPADGADPGKPISLRNASADFSEANPATGGTDVRCAVDGKTGTAWSVFPHVNRDHTAVFETAEKVGGGQAARLTVRLLNESSYADHDLGRFRFSFTDDAATLEA